MAGGDWFVRARSGMFGLVLECCGKAGKARFGLVRSGRLRRCTVWQGLARQASLGPAS